MFREIVCFSQISGIRASISNIVYYPSHMHENVMEIICVLDGSVDISDSCMSHRLSAGDVYIFNARDPHRISAVEGGNTILTVHIDLEHYKAYFRKLTTTFFICDSYINRQHLEKELAYIRYLLARILKEYDSLTPRDSLMEEYTRSLLAYLIEKFQFYIYSKDKNNNLEIMLRKGIAPDDPHASRVYRIIDHIYDHSKEKLHLRHIAETEFLSTFYLSRLIKEGCGLSFCELLSMARCEEAEKLLGTTKMTIDDIATECGFSNRKHLNVQFRKWYRMTPSEYRAKARSEMENNADSIELGEYDKLEASLILASYIEQIPKPELPSASSPEQLLSYLVLLHISHNAFTHLQTYLQKHPKLLGQTFAQTDLLSLFDFDSDFPDYKTFAEKIDFYLKK